MTDTVGADHSSDGINTIPMGGLLQWGCSNTIEIGDERRSVEAIRQRKEGAAIRREIKRLSGLAKSLLDS